MMLYKVEMSGTNYTRDGNFPISSTYYIVANSVDEAAKCASEHDRQVRVDRCTESHRVDYIALPGVDA